MKNTGISSKTCCEISSSCFSSKIGLSWKAQPGMHSPSSLLYEHLHFPRQIPISPVHAVIKLPSAIDSAPIYFLCRVLRKILSDIIRWGFIASRCAFAWLMYCGLWTEGVSVWISVSANFTFLKVGPFTILYCLKIYLPNLGRLIIALRPACSTRFDTCLDSLSGTMDKIGFMPR